MPVLLLVISLITTSAFAGLNQVKIQDLNLNYVTPRGTGDFVKFSIDLSLLPEAYSLELEKVEGSYVLRTPMLDFTWSRPMAFLLGIEGLQTKHLSADLGKHEHMIKGESFSFRPEGDQDYKLLGFEAKCRGESREADLEKRLMEDCREHMLVTTDRAEVPGDFLLVNILKELPRPARVLDRPLEDFYLTSHKGDVFLYFLARYYVTAGLRAWGQLHYEDGFKTAVLKINLIKFGIIPVTGRVMKELKKRIKSPNVVIEPPYIRIRLKNDESTESGHSGH